MTGETQSKLRVMVLFGGRSAEHEVSIMSATNVVRALDPARYDVVPVFVTRDGRWLLSRVDGDRLVQPDGGVAVSLIPGGKGKALAVPAEGPPYALPAIDALFPVLHGPHGEDGSVQGAAAVAMVPLVGCDVLGSAVCLDKAVAKRLLGAAGIPVARGSAVREGEVPSFEALERDLGTPLFVKPARQGSSVGVGKVSGSQALAPALKAAFAHDHTVLIEECMAGREIEFAVLEGADGTLVVSRAGEIAPASQYEFYDYESKYLDQDGAALSVPADLPPGVEAAMQDVAKRAFLATGCDGMARVDFFLMPDGHFVVNELNTIPGFTNISMYPKLMGASGIDYPALIDRLIAQGMARAAR